MEFILHYRTERNLFTFWSFILLILYFIYQLVLYFFPYIIDNIYIITKLFKFFFKKIYLIFRLLKLINFFFNILQILKNCLKQAFFLPLKLKVFRVCLFSVCNFFNKFFRILLSISKKSTKQLTKTTLDQFTNNKDHYLNEVETVDEREVIHTDKKQKYRDVKN
jgi:hypothetical protein